MTRYENGLICTASYLNRSDKQCRWNMCAEKCHQSHGTFFSWKYSCKTLAYKILTSEAIQNWVGNIYGFSLC